jgi:hypothetical protein
MSLALAATLLGRAVLAQDSVLVVGTVVSSTTGLPIPYGTYSLAPNGVRRFTNSDGGFSIKLKSRGVSRIAIRQLGFAPLDTVLSLNSPRATVHVRFALTPIAYRLGAIRAIGHRACSEDSTGGDVGGILQELKTNAERELVLRQSYPFQYKLERVNRFEGAITRVERDSTDVMSNAIDAYEPGHVVRERPGPLGSVREMRIPQLTDLANETFISHHCFYYGGMQWTGNARSYVIDFEPTHDLASPDVRGSVMLDSATLQIRRAVFALTRTEDINPPVGQLEVTTTYSEVFPGVTLFREINSVELYTRERPTDVPERHTERQRVIGIKFVGRSPQEMDSAVIWAVAVRSDSDMVVATSANPPLTAADSARARASAMAADLRKAGFFDREKRFPRAQFFGLEEMDRRLRANPANLLPEILWAHIGRIGAGTAITTERCGLNLYVNGKPASLPTDESGAALRVRRLTFGPELPVSNIGAIELYQPRSSAPQEFPRDLPTCGLILLWTRPGISSTTVPN